MLSAKQCSPQSASWTCLGSSFQVLQVLKSSKFSKSSKSSKSYKAGETGEDGEPAVANRIGEYEVGEAPEVPDEESQFCQKKVFRLGGAKHRVSKGGFSQRVAFLIRFGVCCFWCICVCGCGRINSI
jgi:hypothetical protein